jgi:hypothetical protein
MRPTEFELAIPACKQPQAHDIDRAATGIGTIHAIHLQNFSSCNNDYKQRNETNKAE